MVTPTPSWSTVRVHGTWVNQDGSMKAGTYKVTMPVRVTNATDDVIIPKGVFASGPLNTTAGLPSLDVQVPASDDPDNSPQGFQPTIEVTFLDAPGELYALTVPVALSGNAGGIDLATVILTDTLPIPVEMFVRGVPGGLAELDAQGFVLDADGNRVTGAGAALLVVPTATASATLAAAKHTPVDATSGAKTMTLPTTAAAGVLLSVEKTDASTNAVTITGTLRGTTSSIPLTSQYEARTFLSEGSGSWRPVSDHRTAASLSATFAGPGTAPWLQMIAQDFGFSFTALTTVDTATGLPTAATIRWPDGTTGAFTGTTDGANGYTGYTAAYGSKTVTATGITYDSTTGLALGPTGLAVA